MARRTYIPGLFAVVKAVCLYINRWDSKIRANLDENIEPLYDALKSACDAFLEAFGILPKNP